MRIPLRPLTFTLSLVLAALVCAASAAGQSDSLPSWNEGDAKARILSFVQAVTDEASKDYVPPAERIAVFDNDGTLWCEQPTYAQFAFSLHRVRALASEHPEWQTKMPFKAVLAGDLEAVAAGGEKGLVEIVTATHTGVTTGEFARAVADWLATARHPRFDRPYTDCVYQPMLEVLAFLRTKGFKTFIVSGGGIEFVRVFSDRVYGIPPEQVIGSSFEVEYELREGEPALVRLPAPHFINDKAGKPVGIQRHIGRRPLVAFGNSDGDFQMLEWTTAGPGPRLGILVHHDDAAREYAYDRESSIGRLSRGLDEAPKRGWAVVSIKKDWKAVFPLSK